MVKATSGKYWGFACGKCGLPVLIGPYTEGTKFEPEAEAVITIKCPKCGYEGSYPASNIQVVELKKPKWKNWQN